MKTLKIFLLSIFISLIFFSLTSCSDDDVTNYQVKSQSELSVLSKNSSELTSKQIAEYHNIAVELFLNNDDGHKKTIKEIENSVIKLMTDKYPDLMRNFEVDDNYNFIKSEYNAFSINPNQLENIIDNGFNKFLLDKKISKTFAQDLKELTLNDEISFKDKISFLDSYNATGIYESKFIDVYKEVLIASNNLWNLNGTSAKAKMKCSSGVIAADAVGAGLGLFGGPVWSIIQGAVVYIAVNEDCDN